MALAIAQAVAKNHQEAAFRLQEVKTRLGLDFSRSFSHSMCWSAKLWSRCSGFSHAQLSHSFHSKETLKGARAAPQLLCCPVHSVNLDDLNQALRLRSLKELALVISSELS